MKKNHSNNNMIIFSDDDEKIFDELITNRNSIIYSQGVSKNSDFLSFSSNEYSSTSNLDLLSSLNTSGNSPMSYSMSALTSTSNSNILVNSSNLNSSINNSNSNSSSSSSTNIQLPNHSSSSNLMAFKNKNNHHSHWFEDEQNDFHHFNISFNPSGNRVFYAGETLEVHLKVNVKKLQCLVATFECISTSNNHKLHSLEKNKIYSQDIHLYPTDKDLPPQRQRSHSQRISFPLSPIIDTNTATTNTASGIDNHTNLLKRETLIINNDSSNGNTSPNNTNMKKSFSAGDYFTSFNQNGNGGGNINGFVDDDDECTFLEPLPESEDYDRDNKPPVVHSCSEHQVITNRKHKFIFRFTIPSNSPPSIVLNKDSKSGVFYRLFIQGLGELHGSKFNTDKAMIKGIQTTVPLTIQTLNLTYLPKQLYSIPIQSFSNNNINNNTNINGNSNIHLKSRLICKNYGIIGSNISIHISIDNQSNSLIKGFKIDLFNIQKSFHNSMNNSDDDDHYHLHEDSSSSNSNNKKEQKSKEKEKSNKKLSKKEKELQQQIPSSSSSNSLTELDDNNDSSKRNNIISSIIFKSTDKYIQPKSKYIDTISFSIPFNTIPSVYLNNLLSIYILKISLRKFKSCYVEVPLLIIPRDPN